ncbi:glycosyltransferase family 4 protein [Caldimonas tepidiphila]|uniref:glycosyltransferase family 4 protein n=1 Tax=Caldimonas tepidiphila TaxID=2315841 RepID=UPI000E5AB942|nr:glycosyltransferase family 4 protein [Caldimonas tepidiphila]
MKSVLQVMDYAAPYRGSFIESLDRLDRELRKDGSRIVYVFPPNAATNSAAQWIGEMERSGSKTYFLTGRVAEDARLLRGIIREHDIGIVHTHFENFRIDLAVYLATLFSGVRKVRHFRNHFPHRPLLKKAIKRVLFRDCDFICVSNSVTEGIRQEFPRNRSHAVENAIQYGRLDQFETLRKSDFGMDENSLVCFMMGFDFRRKGVDLALEAVRGLRERMDVRLMISVSANLDTVKEHIRSQLGSIPEWVVLVPPRNDIASYYRMADVFVSASREEGFCNALVEAAYCERMVVASRIPAQGDLQIPHAFWFEPGNAQDLRRQLLQALERRGSYAAELRQARHAVEQTYDISAWAQKIVSIYRSGTPAPGGQRRRTQPV